MLSGMLFLAFLTSLGHDGTGTTAFSLLRVPISPRACALGETYTGLADDVDALFWNPAGLATVLNTQVSLCHHEWFADIRDENASISLTLGPGTLGIGTVYSSVTNIELWDPETGQSLWATSRSGYASIGYGMPVGQKTAVGILIKGLYDDLVNQRGYGLCADAGLLYRPFHWLRLGLVGQHLGWGMKYSTDHIPLPSTFRFGISTAIARLRFLADINTPLDERPQFHSGMEYSINRTLSLRIGYRIGPNDLSTLSWTSGITTGIGLSMGPLALDYAFIPYGRLGYTHRLALRTTFNRVQYGSVRVRVYDSNTGTPVPATISLEGTHQGLTYTESNGGFLLEGIEAGWLKVTATADRYYPRAESILVQPRTKHTLAIALTRSGFGSIWGVVYSKNSRRPLSTTVYYTGPDSGSIQTDDINGSFTLRKVPAGFYQFRITPADTAYLPLSDTITVKPGQLSSRVFILGDTNEERVTYERTEEPAPGDSAHSSDRIQEQ